MIIHVMSASLSEMSLVDLEYSRAFCDWQVRVAAVNGSTLDLYEKRRLQIEAEITKRRKVA